MCVCLRARPRRPRRPSLQHAPARMQTVAPLLTGGTVVASMCILDAGPVDEKKTCRVFTA